MEYYELRDESELDRDIFNILKYFNNCDFKIKKISPEEYTLRVKNFDMDSIHLLIKKEDNQWLVTNGCTYAYNTDLDRAVKEYILKFIKDEIEEVSSTVKDYFNL